MGKVPAGRAHQQVQSKAGQEGQARRSRGAPAACSPGLPRGQRRQGSAPAWPFLTRGPVPRPPLARPPRQQSN